MKRYAEGDAGRGVKRLTLKELPPEERPRERLIGKGEASLTDAELLAIVIRDGTQRALWIWRGVCFGCSAGCGS